MIGLRTLGVGLLVVSAPVVSAPRLAAAREAATHTAGGSSTAANSNAVMSLSPRVEAPDRRETDGVYGRFDGDLDLGVGIGTEITDSQASGQLAASLHYYSTVGLYLTYADAFQDQARVVRVVAVELELRPLFIPRWAYNLEQGPGFWDLLLDSTGVGIGAFWDQPGGEDFGARHGLEAFVGLGVPLFSRAQGLWLNVRGLRRFADTAEGADYNALLINVSWHELFRVGLAGN